MKTEPQKMPQVSVILPNYNHASYLEKRLQSILNQTFKDFELIILDDCSTDNSRDIIEQYRNSPLVAHIIYNERNSGSTFMQWQKGIECAAGEYIWIAESDDWSERTFLEELMPAFRENENVAVAFCQTLYVSTKNEITYRTQADYLSEIIDGREFLKKKMLGNNTIVNASMAVFRKSSVKFVSPDYMQMKYCGDWMFWVNLCFTGDVYVSGKYLNYYLRHNNNVASNATRQGYDFTEGNRIYHFITGRLGVEEPDKINALKQRVTEYIMARHAFLNSAINREVLSSMNALDPSFTSLLRKKMLSLRLHGYLNRIIKWFA